VLSAPRRGKQVLSSNIPRSPDVPPAETIYQKIIHLARASGLLVRVERRGVSRIIIASTDAASHGLPAKSMAVAGGLLDVTEVIDASGNTSNPFRSSQQSLT